MKPAYYNEHDLYAAQWLRNLIAAGHIAPGDVDTRSIEDVQPDDLKPYTQCHFFAGIGVWSYALRRAGWPDDRRIWTMSCPCQPFSAAGQGAAFADERHLWPAAFHLISQCRPARVLGEQVANKDAEPWIDLVQADMEAVEYDFGAVPFPSAGVGAPHIRDRLYWVAYANGGARGKGRAHLRGRTDGGYAQPRAGLGGSGMPDGLADAAGSGPQGSEPAWQRTDAQRAAVERDGAARGMAHARHDDDAGEVQTAHSRRAQAVGPADQPGGCGIPLGAGPGPVNGMWSAADWLLCRDGKWRPVEPDTFPLVAGAVGRVGRVRADWHTPAGPQGFGHRAGRLKGYGNAINAEAAVAFIQSLP